jgi:HAD superfamily hydrolase (TIGR01509 family)
VENGYLFRYIIWDFDGTLYDTYPEISGVMAGALGGFGIVERREDILANLHVSLSHSLKYYSEKHHIPLDALSQRFFVLEEDMDVSSCLPFEGAIETVEKVRENGGSNFIFTNRGKSTFRFLDRWNHRYLFDEIITRESGFDRKPSPDAINHIVCRYSLEKDRVIMVGDRDVDLNAAINAGIRCCYFDSHGIPSKARPDYSVRSFRELGAILL